MDKRRWLTALTLLGGAVVLYLGLPIMTATNRYYVAKANRDYWGMCEARSQVANAWASAGLAGMAADWHEGEALECLVAKYRN